MGKVSQGCALVALVLCVFISATHAVVSSVPVVPPPTVDVSSSPWLANAGSIPAPPAGRNALAEVQYGAELFTHGKVTASIDAFNNAMEWDGHVSGTLWQRGCAMYYTEQWDEGAKQFAHDVALNPHDTEEAIWRWLCQARTEGTKAATAQLLNTTGETRPYMAAIYGMFRTGSIAAQQEVLALCTVVDTAAASLGHSEPPSQAGQACFYSNMYFGLFAEAHGNLTAQAHLRSAAMAQYGYQSRDYMWWLSRVHCAVRGWPMI